MPGSSPGVTSSLRLVRLHRSSANLPLRSPSCSLIFPTGASRRENAEVCQRHCEEPLRRSNPCFVSPSCKMDCFASLAMTAEGLRLTLTRHHPPPGRRDAPPDDRLRRATQYSRHANAGIDRPRPTGSPGQAGRRQNTFNSPCGRAPTSGGPSWPGGGTIAAPETKPASPGFFLSGFAEAHPSG
jgi:hypothetical protein